MNRDRKVFGRPYLEEEGYATNGSQSFAIRSLRLDTVSTNAGKSVKVFGGKLLGGYELLENNDVIGGIDILENSIWLNNKLSPDDKLVLSAIASAILLKRIRDVEKEDAES